MENENKAMPTEEEIQALKDWPLTKTVHLYDPTTKEYLGPYDAHRSPLEPGEYIIPVHALDEAPPKPKHGHGIILGDKGKWEEVKDNRGIWYNEDGEVMEVISLTSLTLPSWSREKPIPKLTPRQEIEAGILSLERTVTPRRIREAVLGIDNGWLEKINSDIQKLRKKLD